MVEIKIGESPIEVRIGEKTAMAQTATNAALQEAVTASAFVSSILYPDTTAGLAVSAEGDYFMVAGDGIDTYAVLYREEGGIAVRKAEFSASSPFDLPSASGGDDEPIINAALALAGVAGGGVVRGKSGAAYQIGGTLLIPSRTTLDLTGCTVERTASGSIRMISNPAMLATGASASIAWSEGLTATVTQTAHGLSRYGYIWLRHADQAQFRGVFRVISVLDADTYVIQLYREPNETATGTITAVEPDVDITLVGADLDYAWERDMSPLGTGYNTVAVYFAGVANARVERLRCRNTEKYTLCLSGWNGCTVDSVHGTNCNGDMVKVYGAGFGGTIRNVFGDTKDDFMSVHPREYDVFSEDYMIDNGDVLGVRIENINGYTKEGKLFTLYGTDTGPIIDGVEVDGVHGCVDIGSAGAVLAAHTYVDEDQGVIGSVSIRNVTARGPRVFDLINSAIARIKLQLAGARPLAAGAAFIKVDVDSVIGKMIVGGQTDPGGLDGSQFFQLSGGTIDHLVFEHFRAATLGFFYNNTAASQTLRKLDILNCEIGSTTDTLIRFSSPNGFTASPSITVRDSVIAALDFVETFCPVSIDAENSHFTLGQYLVNGLNPPSGTSTIRVSTRNVTRSGGGWLNGASDIRFEIFSLDIEDVVNGATTARVDGCFFRNAAIGVGTITEAGLVDCHGTGANSWRVRGDPVAQRY